MNPSAPTYVVRRVSAAPPLDGSWEDPAWADAQVASVAWFHPQSSSHHPRTRVKAVHSDRALHVLFRVDDRFVLARNTRFQDPVSQDSCVEFFVRPRTDAGYFNFEINCGGTLLLYYIEDPTRQGTGFARYERVDQQAARDVRIFHSLPSTVDPEIESEVTWSIQYDIPVGVLERYAGPLGDLGGQSWTGNFFKCADSSSHPHWGAWSPIGTELNFHRPEYFGVLELEA